MNRGFFVVMAIFFVALGVREMRRRRLERTLETTFARLEPPNDMHDAAAWDRYWDDQFSDPQIGGLQLMFAEMFSDVRGLVKVMKTAGMSSVLCAGHGVSREAAALARAGFSVVALDLSPRAGEWCQRLGLDEESLRRFIDLDEEASGGKAEYVVGDLTEPEVCPGPFDVIIERRTVQLFGDAKGEALDALAGRLATPGILLSHCHHGAWNPSQPRIHPNEQWFREHGWTIGPGGQAASLEGRVAWLVFTTG